ncbi:PDR/VanB family oxidoreductase [Gordonia jacobaea]|uniref:PDR/VanB family oxidoreductase n=1 Tax=Gordonia jacobaea TaxID=122202 RepID=UPI003D73690B
MTDNKITWMYGRISSTRPAADGIAQITIETEQSHRAEPGSHIDVRIPDGTTRSYSVVSGSADGRAVTIGVRLSPTSNGGSTFMHDLAPGDDVNVTAPLQNFPLRVGARRYVLLAGGIGITAIAAMAAVLRRVGADYRLVYVGRRRSAMAFLPELVALHGDRIDVAVDDEGSGLDVTSLIAALGTGTELYMCGPIRLMDAVRRCWLDHDLPVTDLRYETFGNSGWFDAQEFVVSIPKLDLTTTVSPGDSLLAALEKAGADMMFDCRKGECGLCQVKVVASDGTIDHRDVFLSEKQKSADDTMCCCVSRVVSGGRRASVTLEIP